MALNCDAVSFLLYTSFRKTFTSEEIVPCLVAAELQLLLTDRSINKKFYWKVPVMLLHLWLKLDLWFWGSKSFLIFCFYKFLISVIISPVGMYCPSFEYSLHDTFCSLVEISHVVLDKIFKSCQCIFAILLASICP